MQSSIEWDFNEFDSRLQYLQTLPIFKDAAISPKSQTRFDTFNPFEESQSLEVLTEGVGIPRLKLKRIFRTDEIYALEDIININLHMPVLLAKYARWDICVSENIRNKLLSSEKRNKSHRTKKQYDLNKIILLRSMSFWAIPSNHDQGEFQSNFMKPIPDYAFFILSPGSFKKFQTSLKHDPVNGIPLKRMRVMGPIESEVRKISIKELQKFK